MVIDSFKLINPAYKNWFANKTERRACEQLLELFGLEDTLKKISFLPKLNSMKYAPTTTKPSELFNNLAKIKSFIEKEGSIKNNKRVATV